MGERGERSGRRVGWVVSMGWSVTKGLEDKTVACRRWIIDFQVVYVFKAVRIMMAVE